MATSPLRIGFIGLGNMGQSMARNLLKSGFTVTVWNRSRARADELAPLGAHVAETIAESSRNDIVITMLADDGAVEQVVWKGGLLDNLPAGAIHVSMSTISVALSERLTIAHAEHGSTFVSACVFGRPQAAAERQLFIVAAGPDAALERCQPIFDALGQRTFRFGERPPAANVVKLSGNFLIASAIESLGEAVALARKSGIDPRQYLDMLTSSLFAAPIYKTYGALIAENRYRPAGFRLQLGLKDVGLALDAARAAIVPMPVASLVRDHMLAAIAQGEADADWSALAAIAARNAGLSTL